MVIDSMPSRALRIAIAAAFAALVVSACGVRGPLELPPEAKAQSDAAKKKTDTAAKADPAAPKPPTPHRPFILDGLIQ